MLKLTSCLTTYTHNYHLHLGFECIFVHTNQQTHSLLLRLLHQKATKWCLLQEQLLHIWFFCLQQLYYLCLICYNQQMGDLLFYNQIRWQFQYYFAYIYMLFQVLSYLRFRYNCIHLFRLQHRNVHLMSGYDQYHQYHQYHQVF